MHSLLNKEMIKNHDGMISMIHGVNNCSVQIYRCTYLTMTWPSKKITTGVKLWLMFGNSVPRFAEDTHFYYSYDTWYTRLRAIRCLIKDFSQNACSRDDTRTIVSRHVKHVLRRRLAVVTLGLPVKTSRHEVA